jgi:hypothetical protein
MMKRFKRPDGPLTQAEFDKFNAQRKRVIWAVLAPFAYACVVVAAKKLLDFDAHPAAHFLFGAPTIIWALVEMFKFKCPRCNATPMTTRASLGGGEVEVGSYVALRPKKCHKCGVLFEPPKQDELSKHQGLGGQV